MIMKRSFRILALVLAGLAMCGQQPPQPRLIEVTFVATGKDDGPVTDLKAEEVRLKDANKQQEIVFFEKITAGSVENAPGKAGLYNVVLLDAMNTTYGDLPENRREMLKVLAELQKADGLYVLALRDGIRVVHDFTNPAASPLAKLFAQKADAANPNIDAHSWMFSDEGGLPQFFTPSAVFPRKKIEDTLGAIRAVAMNMGNRPGRKNLFWITASTPLIVGESPVGFAAASMSDNSTQRGINATRSEDLGAFAKDMEITGRQVANSNISIYPVDTRALAIDNMRVSNLNPMKELARETGGVAFTSRKDVAVALRDALNDTKISYVVRYAPSEMKPDGKFHPIKLETTRKDVKLRARNGYYAPSQPAK